MITIHHYPTSMDEDCLCVRLKEEGLPEKMNGKKYVNLSLRHEKCAGRKCENGRRRKFVKFRHHNSRHIRDGKSWVDKGWISFQNLRKDENSVRFIRHEIKERGSESRARTVFAVWSQDFSRSDFANHFLEGELNARLILKELCNDASWSLFFIIVCGIFPWKPRKLRWEKTCWYA